MTAVTEHTRGLHALIPHRGPWLLLERVLDHGDGWAHCQVVPRPGPLSQGDQIPATLAVEYMAQTVAVVCGLRGAAQGKASGAAPVPGYLVAAREVSLHVEAFPVGQPLTVEARHAFGRGSAARFEARVLSGPRVLAEAQLTVYQPVPEETHKP
jgi:predicted hotdog family 3-hydroxylacyl-ACP dehydratase